MGVVYLGFYVVEECVIEGHEWKWGQQLGYWNGTGESLGDLESKVIVRGKEK